MGGLWSGMHVGPGSKGPADGLRQPWTVCCSSDQHMSLLTHHVPRLDFADTHRAAAAIAAGRPRLHTPIRSPEQLLCAGVPRWRPTRACSCFCRGIAQPHQCGCAGGRRVSEHTPLTDAPPGLSAAAYMGPSRRRGRRAVCAHAQWQQRGPCPAVQEDAGFGSRTPSLTPHQGTQLPPGSLGTEAPLQDPPGLFGTGEASNVHLRCSSLCQ